MNWKNLCKSCPMEIVKKCTEERGGMAPRKDVFADADLTYKDCENYKRIKAEGYSSSGSKGSEKREGTYSNMMFRSQ